MTVNDQLHSYYQCCFRSILTRHSPNIIYHIFSNVCCYSKAVFVIPKGPGPAGMTKVQYLTPVQRSWVGSWCWGGKGNWPEEEMRCSEKEKRCGLVIVQTACSLFLSPKWWFVDPPAPTSWHILQYFFFFISINFSCSKSNQTSFPELPHQHSTSICTTLYIGDVLPLKWEQHWQKAEILLILYFSTFLLLLSKHTNGTSQVYKERTGDWLEIKVKKSSLSRGWSIVIYHLWRSAFVILGMFVFMWWFFYLSVICLIVTEIR